MKFLMLIYNSEAEMAAQSEDAMKGMFGEFMALTKSLHESGQHRAGERLQPVATATTVRVRDGKTLTTDGPFAETREQLGGFYMVEAEHLDDALKIAARIPSARLGSIEVRPIWEMAIPAK